jgi:hypothetical protein
MRRGMRQLFVPSSLLALLATLAGCPTVDLGDTPVTPPLCRPSLDTFKMEGGIWDVAVDPPDMTKSCVANAGCHAQATGRSALRLISKPRDQMLDSDWSTNLDVIARFLNCPTPASSEFITKPEAGVDPHLGGDLWTCGGSACEPIDTVEAWIAAH